jgi:doublecortin domain-containing protein 1
MLSYICLHIHLLRCSLIQAKGSPQMVLTVSMKRNTQDGDGTRQTYVGCPVTLQRAKKVQMGRANQKWRYDADSGLIWAFNTDTVDKGERKT